MDPDNLLLLLHSCGPIDERVIPGWEDEPQSTQVPLRIRNSSGPPFSFGSNELMGCDMVVALGRATVDGQTLFAHSSDRPFGEQQALRRIPGRAYTLGEKVRVQFIELTQARQTHTVVGSQPVGCWGYEHGVNGCGVAIGCTSLATKLRSSRPALLGTDLVRLALERARSAQHAVDLITDLVSCHGLGFFSDCSEPMEADSAFLVADPQEAFLIETAERYWVCQEAKEVRAASDVATVRQDWDRIAPGLAGFAIEQGWWPGDGTKLDFAGAVVEDPMGAASALRRWGRATLLLEQQNGHIDDVFLRRLLADHYEGMRTESDPLRPAPSPVPLCKHPIPAAVQTTAASMVAQLQADPNGVPIAWCSLGVPCTTVWFPILLDGDLPDGCAPTEEGTHGLLWSQVQRLFRYLGSDIEAWTIARSALARLQARFDLETEEVVSEGRALKEVGHLDELGRLTASFMQHNLERFEEVVEGLVGQGRHREFVGVSGDTTPIL